MESLIISNINVTRGDEEGELNLSWDSLNDANLYVIQYGTGKQNVSWKVADIVNESRYTIKGLKEKKTYLFRVAVVNSSKQGPWSKVVEKSIR